MKRLYTIMSRKGQQLQLTVICEVSYLVASMLASSALLTAARRRKRYASGDSSS